MLDEGSLEPTLFCIDVVYRSPMRSDSYVMEFLNGSPMLFDGQFVCLECVIYFVCAWCPHASFIFIFILTVSSLSSVLQLQFFNPLLG